MASNESTNKPEEKGWFTQWTGIEAKFEGSIIPTVTINGQTPGQIIEGYVVEGASQANAIINSPEENMSVIPASTGGGVYNFTYNQNTPGAASQPQPTNQPTPDNSSGWWNQTLLTFERWQNNIALPIFDFNGDGVMLSNGESKPANEARQDGFANVWNPFVSPFVALPREGAKLVYNNVLSESTKEFIDPYLQATAGIASDVSRAPVNTVAGVLENGWNPVASFMVAEAKLSEDMKPEVEAIAKQASYNFPTFTAAVQQGKPVAEVLVAAGTDIFGKRSDKTGNLTIVDAKTSEIKPPASTNESIGTSQAPGIPAAVSQPQAGGLLGIGMAVINNVKEKGVWGAFTSWASGAALNVITNPEDAIKHFKGDPSKNIAGAGLGAWNGSQQDVAAMENNVRQSSAALLKDSSHSEIVAQANLPKTASQPTNSRA